MRLRRTPTITNISTTALLDHLLRCKVNKLQNVLEGGQGEKVPGSERDRITPVSGIRPNTPTTTINCATREPLHTSAAVDDHSDSSRAVSKHDQSDTDNNSSVCPVPSPHQKSNRHSLKLAQTTITLPVNNNDFVEITETGCRQTSKARRRLTRKQKRVLTTSKSTPVSTLQIIINKPILNLREKQSIVTSHDIEKSEAHGEGYAAVSVLSGTIGGCRSPAENSNQRTEATEDSTGGDAKLVKEKRLGNSQPEHTSVKLPPVINPKQYRYSQSENTSICKNRASSSSSQQLQFIAESQQHSAAWWLVSHDNQPDYHPADISGDSSSSSSPISDQGCGGSESNLVYTVSTESPATVRQQHCCEGGGGPDESPTHEVECTGRDNYTVTIGDGICLANDQNKSLMQESVEQGINNEDFRMRMNEQVEGLNTSSVSKSQWSLITPPAEPVRSTRRTKSDSWISHIQGRSFKAATGLTQSQSLLSTIESSTMSRVNINTNAKKASSLQTPQSTATSSGEHRQPQSSTAGGRLTTPPQSESRSTFLQQPNNNMATRSKMQVCSIWLSECRDTWQQH